MRGALVGSLSVNPVQRIIPADAGSTFSIVCFCFSSQDHPRRCGEHILHRLLLFFVTGSSPQMRGAHTPDVRNWRIRGIIPADAGSTTPRSCPVAVHPDHPRRCGEHPRPILGRPSNSGSSPQMRGAPAPHPAHQQAAGIIPADAGSTSEDSLDGLCQ